MKVILSRKGLDSTNGGIVSPILEDGTMISFPIPGYDQDTFDELAYNGISYTRFLKDLNYKWNMQCHIDPDLDIQRRTRNIENWVPAFGQCNSSAVYLKNAGVQTGDLFLFFGNFHSVKYADGKYSYKKNTGDFFRDNDLQAIWGYLQVGEIISEEKDQKKLWWHPHASDTFRRKSANVIFKASENLSFDKNKSVAGFLTIDRKRVLTKEGCNKATWKMNEVYSPEHLIGCRRKNSAKDPDSGIYYAGIWQELCLKESEECSEWAKMMIL